MIEIATSRVVHCLVVQFSQRNSLKGKIVVKGMICGGLDLITSFYHFMTAMGAYCRPLVATVLPTPKILWDYFLIAKIKLVWD